MRISNKNLLIIILAGVAILIGWSWLNQSGFLYRNTTSENSGMIENQNKNQIKNNSIENLPRIRITFPGNSAVLNPGTMMVRYSVMGNLDEVARVDLTLFKGSEVEFHQQGSFSKINRTGGQMLPNLEEGEYRLLARLIKNDNTYFSSPLAESIINFQIKDTSKGN